LDRATGIVALKTRLEAEQGRVLTLRPLEDALHGLGLAVNTATLALDLYATDRLRALGEVVPDLAGWMSQRCSRAWNALRRYAHARAGIEEEALYGEVFDPSSGRWPVRSVKAKYEGCEVALARRLGEPVEVLRQAMSSGATRPERVTRCARMSSGDPTPPSSQPSMGQPPPSRTSPGRRASMPRLRAIRRPSSAAACSHCRSRRRPMR